MGSETPAGGQQPEWPDGDDSRRIPPAAFRCDRYRGGITFRGSNNPGLLINGVPYGLLEEYSGDMLIQLPALFFDRVSMTSTPSIGLVPDGDAGILNLSSAVYTAADSPLVLTLGAGFQERYNAGAILNLHPGKFHIVGKYNYRREFRKRTFSKSTTNKGGQPS